MNRELKLVRSAPVQSKQSEAQGTNLPFDFTPVGVFFTIGFSVLGALAVFTCY